MFSEAYIIFSVGQIGIFQKTMWPACYTKFQVCDEDMVKHLAGYIQVRAEAPQPTFLDSGACSFWEKAQKSLCSCVISAAGSRAQSGIWPKAWRATSRCGGDLPAYIHPCCERWLLM